MPIKLPHRRPRGMPNLNVPPGTLQVEEGASRPVLTAFGFSPQGFEEITLQDPAETREERRAANEILTMRAATEQEIAHAPDYELPGADLLRWPRLWPFLQRILSRSTRGSRPDLPKLVRMLAQGKAITKMPILPRGGMTRVVRQRKS